MYEEKTTNEELISLMEKGEIWARNMLIEQNTGLVHSVVKRFLGRGQETEDLFQVGCIGLIKAVKKFDSSFGVKFSTYAVPMIMGEIKRFIRDDGIIKVSRSLKETAAKAMVAKAEIEGEKGGEATLFEIAERLEIAPSELSVAIEASIRPESLNQTTDDGTHEGKPLIERIEEEKDYETEIVDRITLRQILSEFEERDRKIILMRYFKHKTQTQTAEKLGISQVQVSRIEKKLLMRMRERLISGESNL